MATIFQRGKYWRAQIRRKGYPTLTATFDTKLEAQQWAVQKEREIAEQSPERIRQRIRDRRFTLGDALHRYEREVLPSKSESARKREPSTLRLWRAEDLDGKPLADLPLIELDGQVLSRIVGQWTAEERLSANTIRLRLALLSFLYNVARKEWGMTELINPVPLIRKPRLPRGRDRRLVGDEEERLLKACETVNPELADIVRFAIETAMRQGEILGMTWGCIDWKTHTVFLANTKNGESRVVPLSEVAEAVLERQQSRTGSQKRPSYPVWSYTANWFRESYANAVKNACIEGLTFHDLRHEATSRLVEKGLPIMTVQAITGHKSTQMLKRYTHISAQALVEAIRARGKR